MEFGEKVFEIQVRIWKYNKINVRPSKNHLRGADKDTLKNPTDKNDPQGIKSVAQVQP